MQTIDPTERYTMPTCGQFRTPRPWEQGGMRYGKSTSLSVTFLSDAALIERLLPESFHVGSEPLVTVSYVVNEDVDWLAGRGYNLVGVDVAAVFDGEVDRGVHGSYCVVMWENMTEPIIGGRDHSGVPKVFGDIPDLQRKEGACSGRLSHFGHPILDISATALAAGSADDRAVLERARRDGTWMCYKCIPRLENDGADVAYATVYPSSGRCKSVWSGQGALRLYPSSFKQNPTQHEVINLLAKLPIHEIRGASLVVWEPLMALDRLPRRLQ